jgi:hypothetical protein
MNVNTVQYRGYELDRRSIMGGVNISRDGEYVDHVLGGMAEARAAVDQMVDDD